MQPSNNFIFTGGSSDPLLNPGRGYDLNGQLDEINRLQEMIQQKQQFLQNAKEQVTRQQQAQAQTRKSQTPIWDEIDSITQSMSDKEFEIISNNEEFIESNNKILAILQSAYMEMMRPIVEGSQKGKDALESHLTLVRRLKKSASKEVDKEMSDFKEYTEKYSDMPYSEYLKMKKDKQSKGNGGKK